MTRSLLSRLRMGAICIGTVVLITISATSWALGLGEIELNSALNEKLDANIDLIDSFGLQPTEILVALAKTEDFENVGVERFFYLTDLKFEVVLDQSGRAKVVVTSSRPITEPYLNFLVRITWANGRLLKEYTVLLDPPTFSTAAAPAVAAPTRPAAQNDGRVQRSTVESGTRVQLAPSAAERPQRAITVDEYGMPNRNDTLWSIASRTRPSQQVSIQQNMLAIQRLNPQAFISDNINLL